MIDYLEEQGGAEALLEEERLLDTVLAGMTEVGRSAEEQDGSEGSGTVVRAVEQEPLSGKGSALLDEITRLERAGVIHSSEDFWGENRKTDGTEGRPGLVRQGVGAGLEPEPGAGGRFAPGQRQELWGESGLKAEQIDRIFRRDSRRYDGGFFLY